MVQTVTTEINRKDLNDDGITDEMTTVVRELTGDRVDVEKTTINNTLYPYNTVSQTRFTYDDFDLSELPVQEFHQSDWDANGTWDTFSTLDRLFDGEGHTTQEIVSSPDWDADGAPDYQNITIFTENFAGSVTEKMTTYYTYGSTNPSDYLKETWTYAADGQQVKSHMYDDPLWLDCEITDFYTYNKAGQLINIKEQNEIRYGDTRARIDESMTYNKDGTIKTHTDWADYTDEGWFQRKDIAYTWKAGFDSEKITYDLQGDFDPEVIKLVEHWYNAAGNLTHTLVSKDMDGNGGVLAGGFDSRDLTVATWVGDEKVAEYTDEGLDGIIDSSFTSTTVDMLVA